MINNPILLKTKIRINPHMFLNLCFEDYFSKHNALFHKKKEGFKGNPSIHY